MTLPITQIVANFQTTLAIKNTVGQTTGTLTSNVDKDGNTIPNGTYCFLCDASASGEEHVMFNLTGTAMTAVQHISRQGVATSGFLNVHNIGATMQLTDFANIKTLSDTGGGGGAFSAIISYASNFTPTLGLFNLASWDFVKSYIDGVAIAGSPDSTTTTKGISKMSVAPALATSPIAVGDNDPRVPTASQALALVGNNGTPSGTNTYVTQTSLAINIPVGTVVDYISPTAPTNWAICNGSAISRTTYATLFAIIGTSFGVGDGSTTFNIPNIVGKVTVMQDGGQTEFQTMGETGGEKVHTLLLTEMPSHSHQLKTYDLSSGTNSNQPATAGQVPGSGVIGSTTELTGGGASHNNLQPYIVMTKIIKII